MLNNYLQNMNCSFSNILTHLPCWHCILEPCAKIVYVLSSSISCHIVTSFFCCCRRIVEQCQRRMFNCETRGVALSRYRWFQVTNVLTSNFAKVVGSTLCAFSPVVIVLHKCSFTLFAVRLSMT